MRSTLEEGLEQKRLNVEVLSMMLCSSVSVKKTAKLENGSAMSSIKICHV